MSEAVRSQITKSSQDFLSLVWPAIGQDFGTPFPVESVTENAFARELDARAGIDIWLLCRDGHMRGLASRVQWTDDPYDTFTVRMRARFGGPTEYHKRRAEITAKGVITPHYFCQAYVSQDRGRLISAAVARMRDVIAAVNLDLGWLMSPNPDGTQGYAVRWDRLKNTGAPVRTWAAGNPQQLSLEYESLAADLGNGEAPGASPEARPTQRQERW